MGNSIKNEQSSIEEDIKDIEKYISFTSKSENFSHDTDWNWNKDLANKIEHILLDYKRVLKENEYMHNELDKQQTTINKYAKENKLAKQEYDRDTHILQNQLYLANADRIELAQQNKELRKEKETLLNICSKHGGALSERK